MTLSLRQIQASQDDIHVLDPIPVAVDKVAQIHVLHPRDGHAAQARGWSEGTLPGAEAANHILPLMLMLGGSLETSSQLEDSRALGK
jgi:hypothetical protein